MAEAFAYENKPYTRETERFVRTFDKFFDLMNLRSLKEGVYKCKPNLKPYRNDAGSTERLQVATCHPSCLFISGWKRILLAIWMSGEQVLLLELRKRR